jgi:polysaccharide pyruvyl transferase WcaK-like protein
LLVGYFARGNLGDDAMLSGFAHYLAEAVPAVEVITVPLPPRGPEGWIPMARLLRQCCKSDSLSLVGGTHFHDAYGRRSLPILGAHLLLLLMARLSGCRIGLAGVGVGPLRSQTARLLTRQIFRLSTASFVRDSLSLEVVRQAGVRSVDVGFDLAALLEFPVHSDSRQPVERIAVSLVPYFEAYHANGALDARFVQSVASALRCASDSPVLVDVLTLNRHGRLADTQVCARLADELRAKGIATTEWVAGDPEELVAVLDRADAVIATRYHAALLAFMVAKPLIVIAYEAKCVHLADQIGLPAIAMSTPEGAVRGDEQFSRRVAQLMADPHEFLASLSPEAAQDTARGAARRFVQALVLA